MNIATLLGLVLATAGAVSVVAILGRTVSRCCRPVPPRAMLSTLVALTVGPVRSVWGAAVMTAGDRDAVIAALLDAHRYYRDQVGPSWVPDHLIRPNLYTQLTRRLRAVGVDHHNRRPAPTGLQ